jgi:hypothetical protein
MGFHLGRARAPAGMGRQHGAGGRRIARMDQGAAARQALRRGDWAAAQRLATGLLARSPAEGRFILGVAAAALGRVPSSGAGAAGRGA